MWTFDTSLHYPWTVPPSVKPLLPAKKTGKEKVSMYDDEGNIRPEIAAVLNALND